MTPGPEALHETLEKLCVHFEILLAISLSATLVDAAVAGISKKFSFAKIAARAVSNLSCGTLGLTLAYFSAQGLTEAGNTATLTAMATGLSTLIAAGLTLFENRDHDTTAVLKTGVACFLLTAIVSYETFSNQSGLIGPRGPTQAASAISK